MEVRVNVGITPAWALTIRNGCVAGTRASFDRDQGTGATCVEQSPTAALPMMSRTRREMAERAAQPTQEVDQGHSEAAAPERTMRAEAPSPEMSTTLPALQAADAAWPRPDARHERDDDPSQRLAEALDRAFNYALSRVTLGLSPAALAEAYFDWMVHLAVAPGKQLQLTQKALRKTLRFWHYAATCALQQRPGSVCIEPLPNDKRFSADAWRAWPFNAIHQAFLLQQQWWHNATTGVRGVTPQHERQVEFATRQILDVFSPANFVLTNPEVLRKTQAEAGQNLVRGFWNFVEDWERTINGRKPVGAEAFKVGENLALYARQGDLPQPADRADPVHAGDRQGAARARADRAGVDHEVLHPRSHPGEVAGEIPGGAGLHRVHDLLEEPRSRGSRPLHWRTTGRSASTQRSKL